MDGTRWVAGNAWRLAHRARALAVLVATLLTAGALAGPALAARPSIAEGQQFTIEKLQLIAGSEDAGFTTEPLTAEVGQTVEYEIVVTNTGDSTLTFSPLTDPNCTDISPAGTTELEPQESETFTCETLLSEPGPWSNEAEIEAGEQREVSNEVLVEVPEEPEFTVEKLQAIKGSGNGFTTGELAGTAGQTVEYEIIVANMGNTTLSFSPLEDTNCTNISPAGETELAPGDSETFTCEHTLTTPGQIWSNEVTVQSGELSEDSNEVFVRTLEQPEFTIEKLQQIQGSDTPFTQGELAGKLGETVDYEIVVSNTGARALTFAPLEDANCTNVSPAGATELAPAASETFTCQHSLTAAGTWTNVAAIEAAFKPREQPSIRAALRPSAIAAPGEGAIKKATSNQVIVNVPAEPVAAPESKATTSVIAGVPQQVVQARCTISESLVKLYGASGGKRKPFTVRVPALGIKEITFYLDGRRIKVLSAPQAKHGRFEIEIDPGTLGYGAHRVSVKTLMSETACPAVARSAVFVHARPKVVKPRFTG
jgi:uncharacterized repeat protein (TIGR01451 family)